MRRRVADLSAIDLYLPVAMIKKQPIKKSKLIKVTFVLPGDHPYGKISVVGDFNGWDASANLFGKRNNGTYSTSVKLDAGQRLGFRYYADDGRWVDEDDTDGHEPTPFGSVNCILET